MQAGRRLTWLYVRGHLLRKLEWALKVCGVGGVKGVFGPIVSHDCSIVDQGGHLQQKCHLERCILLMSLLLEDEL